METKYKVYFEIKNLGKYRFIPGIKRAMQDELMRVYNLYANETNAGVTEELNECFERFHPNYFEDNKDKEWYDLTEYNQYMADGYQKMIVDKFNESNISSILDFYVDPEEVTFEGRLKCDHNVTISFYMKEAK